MSGFAFGYAVTGFVQNCVVKSLACPGVVLNPMSEVMDRPGFV
jgi:hypothetical protein